MRLPPRRILFPPLERPFDEERIHAMLTEC